MRHVYGFYADSAKIALQSIFAHKLRAFLTLIGIIIGVASVVVVGASISGLNTYIVERISRLLGANHFMMARMASTERLSEEEWEEMNRRNKRLDWDDVDWLQHQCDSCTEIGAQVINIADLKESGQEMFAVQIQGVTSNMGEIEDKTISEGRFIHQYEVEHAGYVCVIGAELSEKFYPGVDPIGRELKIKDVPMRIVGVEQKRGSMFGQPLDRHAYIPITTYAKLFGRRQSLQIHGKAGSRESFERTIEDARVAMRNHHKLRGNDKDDFGILNFERITGQIDQFTGAIALVVTPITMISLIVGAIVVMNIMLVSVTERTFEIGLRKAVGARKRHIMFQFLIESAILTSFGGVMGLLTAAGISGLIRVTTEVPMTITIWYVAMSLAVSGGVGILAGIYPAYKAARMDPIMALAKQ
jgi:putative ABC transport system permease protein